VKAQNSTEKDMRKKKIFVNRTGIWVLFIFLAVIIVLTGVSIIYFRNALEVKGQQDSVEYNTYNKHYAFIVDDITDTFWESVYESAKSEGEKNNIYLEQSGKNLAVDFTKSELMVIAINSEVDGVIIEGDDSKNLLDLINTAVDKGIPVVTVLSDCDNSNRQSFVGVNGYHIGQVYGEQVLKIDKDAKSDILVLMNTNTNDTSKNIIYTGIQDTLNGETNQTNHFNLSTLSISNESTFATEESIRDVFMNEDSLPDIMICLDEVSTTSASQAVVDYNKVGEVNIIGCFTSEKILNDIEREVINSTISIDSNQLGSYCMNALMEYEETGNVSEYMSVDIKLITDENVGEYLNDDEKAQE
jgi:ribose transport system substrate-binding protein